MSVRGRRQRKRLQRSDFRMPGSWDRYEQIQRDLRCIKLDWPDLDEVRAAIPPPTTGRARPASSRAPSWPVIAVSEDVAAKLREIVALVVDARHLIGPSTTDVDVLARWLGHHAEWLARIPTEADGTHPQADTIAQCRADLARVILGTDQARRVPIGACPLCLDAAGVVIVTTEARVDGASHTSGAVSGMPDAVCDLDPDHRWDESEYHVLAEAIGQGAAARMKVAEFVLHERARGRSVSERTVWGWVWRRPLTIGWDEETKTLDRVKALDWWMQSRARRAS